MVRSPLPDIQGAFFKINAWPNLAISDKHGKRHLWWQTPPFPVLKNIGNVMTQAAKILIIHSDYYQKFSDGLIAGAMAELERAHAIVEKVEVPGVLEIPAALALAVAHEDYDGFVLIGCVIRGETTHYEIVAIESARAIMDLVVRNGLAVGNAIQTVENADQAWARANPEDKNKGGAAAAAALAMVALRRKLTAKSKA